MDLTSYDVIVVNTSGGKDSQVSLGVVHKMATEQGVADRMVAVHADLGRVEWANTKELAAEQAAFYGVRFEAIKRPQGDLLDHVESRGMWPSSTARYCTSDHKRGQCAKIITKLTDEVIQHRNDLPVANRPQFYEVQILNIFGFRAEESPARAKVPVFQENKRLTNGKRIVHDWLPIRDMLETEVWASIKVSGVPYHKAYDLGMPRLSCVFCVFAPKAALVIAGHANPELLNEYVAVEKRIDHTFRKDMSMADVKAAVDAGEVADISSLDGAWNM